MKRALSLLLALAMIGLAGCRGAPAGGDASGSPEEGAGDKPEIVVVLKTVSSQYWRFVEAGAKQAFADLGVNGTVIGPASEAQVMEQVNMLEDALSRNPDALVVAPIQPSTAIPVFERYREKGIPVILIDTDAGWPGQTTFIGTDNATAGRQGGELLASMLQPGDKVALISGALGNPATDARIKGAKAALEKAGMVVVAQQPADSDKAKAMAVMENILQTAPDVKGVFCANDDMAIGALRAIEAKGRKLPVIGTDGTLEALEAILAGSLAGTVAQRPVEMGYKGVEYALKVVKGETIPRRITVGVDLLTRDNAAEKMEFLKQITK
ncbi:MAG: sugar ABC transporter substrate-binding protein [Calditerricola sp.]|nr:sugar ABC transporter substrate-binding protein [Calditerricola sp.]